MLCEDSTHLGSIQEDTTTDTLSLLPGQQPAAGLASPAADTDTKKTAKTPTHVNRNCWFLGFAIPLLNTPSFPNLHEHPASRMPPRRYLRRCLGLGPAVNAAGRTLRALIGRCG
ncbi:unnamed protein product [Coccothraustes coccothraustes]